jgi:hypothetical protein
VFSFPYQLEKPSKNDKSRLGNNGIFHFFEVKKKAICDRTENRLGIPGLEGRYSLRLTYFEDFMRMKRHYPQ